MSSIKFLEHVILILHCPIVQGNSFAKICKVILFFFSLNYDSLICSVTFGYYDIDKIIFMQASRVASAALTLCSDSSNIPGANAIDLEALHVSVSKWTKNLSRRNADRFWNLFGF